MLKFYKTSGGAGGIGAGVIKECETPEAGCWINLYEPTEAEISRLETELNVERTFLRSALDEEEVSRIEREDGQTLLIVDYPVSEHVPEPSQTRRHSRSAGKGEHEGLLSYYTMPMSIILTDRNVITVSLKKNSITDDFANGCVKGVETGYRARFIFSVLLRIAGKYLQNLKQIDKLANYVENRLHHSMKNKELIQLLDLEKSLVYFSTSLKATETTLEKILRGRVIKLYDDDQDLLEDVLIEVKQAIEMSGIYSDILAGTMDAFASIISNNLNIVMKVLAVITIIMAIPTMVFSFYGMNVDILPGSTSVSIPLAISAVLGVAATVFFTKSKMYK